MSGKHKTLRDLFHHQLKDLHDAERHVGKILARMAKAASAEALREALDARHDQRALHLDRLESVFEAIDKKAQGVTCEAMGGLIDEIKSLIDDFEEGPTLDAGLIAAAIATEHYAIARYGALSTWAGPLGIEAAPIEDTLSEARGALARWTALAAAIPAPDVSEYRVAHTLTLKEAALMGLK